MAVATRVARVDLAAEGLEVDEAGKPCTQCTQSGAPERPESGPPATTTR